VIIGAMIIAPLMDPLLRLSLANALEAKQHKLKSALQLVIGIVIALIVSLLVAFIFSGINETQELLARTRPNIMDLFVALGAGGLGGISKIRPSLNNSVAEIAISPNAPLCASGIFLAKGDFVFATGAFLLFSTNVISIIISASLIFRLSTFGNFQKQPRLIITSIIIMGLLAIPLGINFSQLLQESRLRREIDPLVKTQTESFKQVDITRIDVDRYQTPTLVTITIRSPKHKLNPGQVKLVQTDLSEKIGEPLDLRLAIVPVDMIEAAE
jgi:uncharacterized membrane protein